MEKNDNHGSFLSVFSPSSKRERIENFENYWLFTQKHSGKILEDEKTLTKKQEALTQYQTEMVRSQHPLPNPELFYRNYVRCVDNPLNFDKKTLLLTCLYKFARHEWVGISAAWDAVPLMAHSHKVTEKISRYHLCEEFCHVRFFHEMFRTFHLDEVQWVPLGKSMQWIYRIFPRIPEKLMAAPAFVTELMGMTFYLHVDGLLDEVFADEPAARDRVRELLYEIMTDELAHIGQRRNFLGKLGIKVASWLVRPLYRIFFRDIPEAKYLFDIDQMISEGLVFDYSSIPSKIIDKSWIPSYCRV